MIEYMICWSIEQLTNKFLLLFNRLDSKVASSQSISNENKGKKFKFSFFSVILTKYSKWDQ